MSNKIKQKKPWYKRFIYKEKVKPEDTFLSSGSDKLEKSVVYRVDYNTLEVLVPDGLNPHNNGHLIINDMGRDLYVRTFYVDSLPNNADFAVTFVPLFNFPDSTCSAHTRPLTTDKASKTLDNDITNLETESLEADKSRDRNRSRKLAAKIHNTEKWAVRTENNATKLTEVCFLVSIYADSLHELNVRTGDLFTSCKRNTIILVNAYGYQYEAYMANQPINNLEGYVATKGASLLPRGFKWHRMDQESLACIFNHTSNEIYHEHGIYLGWTIGEKSPVVFDLYDKSHKGYGAIVAGTTGGGKSLFIKLLMLRNLASDYRFVIMDSESPGSRGEYAVITEKLGGVNYYFAPGSKEILNIFEITEEYVYDETNGREYLTLNLKQKITDATQIVMTMVEKNKTDNSDYKYSKMVESIVKDIIQDLYRAIKLEEGNVDSLYDNSNDMNMISSGKKKKTLPTFSDFYRKFISYKNREKNTEMLVAYTVLGAAIKEYVRELRICNTCGKEYTKEEFRTLNKLAVDGVRYRECECGCEAEFIEGTNPYYDGHSTIDIQDKRIVNIDISQISEREKPVAQAIALLYIKEVFIKKNAMNPLKAKKLGVIFDEVHKAFKYKDARDVVIETYRVARKRFVAPITATQSIADYTLYDETAAIIKNAAAMMLFAHKRNDIKALGELTELTESQRRNTLSFGVGECYIIDNDLSVRTQIDYLMEIERPYVETDISVLKLMRQQEMESDMVA